MTSWAASVPGPPGAAAGWIVSISPYVSLAASICTCVTLYLLYAQTRCQTVQARHIAEQTGLLNDTSRAGLYQNVMKEMQEISRIFLDAPELRRYFYGESPPPPDPDLSARVE